mmetsp:Transcript_15102/g.18943  ORF Transcript_15102/g.18943 Transcript_15102/m.18943 type:complete len:121 (+) Transcript_15102:1-363(+)
MSHGGPGPMQAGGFQQDGINSVTQTPEGYELSVFPTIMTHLVGRGGMKIRELSNSTGGAVIKAQNRDSVVPGQMDRKIYISGNPDAVERGLATVRQFIEELFNNHPEMRDGSDMKRPRRS